MEEEMRFHMEMETERLVRERGLEPEEARRQAAIAFGGVEKYKEEGREVRGLSVVTGLSLDFRLGWRMLRKHPGLTLVGGLAIAFAIWVGVGAFEFIFQVIRPTLPFARGDRVVSIRNWNAASSDFERARLDDFVRWRGELRSIDELGAYRTLRRNLITTDGVSEPVAVADISASAFPVTGTRPLLGRTLTVDDERVDAPPVVVLGYDAWQNRFAGDPGVVGRVVHLGREPVTVVGVMPEGFGFPWAHSVWTPLRLNVLDYQPDEMPEVEVFGRLAAGFSLEEAQAELTTLGQRAAAAFPDTHEHLRLRVMPYATGTLGLRAWMSLGLLSMNGFVLVLLVVLCGNVALLMFARAAARETEIVVRNALGASRRRIVAQMFTEALVLAALAGAVGLALAGVGLRWLLRVIEDELLGGDPLPFWFHRDLSPASLVYAVVLVVLAAAIAGVVPALKMTREGLEGRLRERGAGSGGPRFGGIWTAVIVLQVSLTVLLPYFTYQLRRDMKENVDRPVAFAAEQYLSARLEMDREAATASADVPEGAFLAHVHTTAEELARRVLGDPAVAGVTFASNVPRHYHPWNQIEMDEGAVAPRDTVRGHRVSRAFIAPDYFEVLGTHLLAGRAFRPGDLASGARTVIVNRAFVETVLGGRNPIGHRVRYLANERSREPSTREAPWYEIVGVAPDLGTTSGYGEAGIYHPLSPDSALSIYMLVHVKGDPAAFAPRFQRLAADVDPALRLQEILPLDRVDDSEQQFYDFWLTLVSLLTLVTLTVAWAGIYAVMSFTVARRTREIGIRVALGGNRRSVILAIFRRPLVQVTLGAALGVVFMLALWITLSDPGYGPTAVGVAQIVGFAAVMLGVCLLACVVPTRRALAIEPMDALRAE
jgi:predicted permease